MNRSCLDGEKCAIRNAFGKDATVAAFADRGKIEDPRLGGGQRWQLQWTGQSRMFI